MYKWILVILLILWVCMLVIAGINMYRHYQVYKLDKRILQDYKDMSALDKIFKPVHDSLQKDILICDSIKTMTDKPFPLKDNRQNWLFIRILVVFLTILTILVFWFYYQNKAKE